MTTATSATRISFTTNKFAWTLALPLIAYWIYGWFYCLDRQDWILENMLVVICLTFFAIVNRKLKLSDASLLCIFTFVMLHLYGAFYAYTNNALGEWLQNKYNLWRNPYDRIVHFSFGFLMAYPFREILITKFKVKPLASWLYPIEIAFSLGTIFEMIEWGVAATTNSVTGDTYVATQGDVWDAHKDIALAALGAALCMLIVFVFKKITRK